MYTDLEYQNHLSSDGEDGKGWSRAETDHLFDLCRRFDLRFTVIHDRYSRNNASSFPQRSIEDLKERYYNVTEKLKIANEEREKKAQDLQKLLDHAEASVTPKQEKKSQSLTNQGASSSKKKTVSVSSAVVPRSSKPDVSSSLDATTGIKFPETSKGSSIYLRSSRMKLPPSVGQKKTKAIETMLTEIQGMEMTPMPTEEIATEFNDLRSDMVLLYELKNALVVCESELQSIKAQYEALAPNKSLEIPDRLKNYFNNKEKTKSISDVIDVVGNGAAPPVRKRKAALEQSNVLKKIKNKNF
ncbi:DMAP1 [Lepeophtheirus salmonis]|uniref:DMAP1 n=1 Tax=Lepeophtheirus salmonis TaxID=72036 RepID=A0A7R8HAA0_LEPSM|nr:DMAP1 [Lepeophtheirus salmonis]CAF2968995.1 DMAP1 [Lepeophtheirus salmonis]